MSHDTAGLIARLDKLNKWLVSLEGTEYVDLHTALDGQEVVQAARETITYMIEENHKIVDIACAAHEKLFAAEARVPHKCESPKRCDAEARICPQDGSTCWGMGCCVSACEARAEARRARAATDEALAKLEQEMRAMLVDFEGEPVNDPAVTAEVPTPTLMQWADTLKALRTSKGDKD